MRLLCLTLTATAWFSGPISAQPRAGVPRAVFELLQWRNIGPDRGGRSLAAAGSPARPLEYYFGATGGGLWKTADGGTTWTPVTDGHIRSSSVGALAVAESDPDIVYIGMGEAQLRSNILEGDGIYKSTDAGRTWANMGLRETHAVSRVRVDPRDPRLVYVAALGHPWGPNEERGIYRSKDGGVSWQRVLFRDPRSGGSDLAIDPVDPRTLYASLWQVRVAPGGTIANGGPGSGLFKSTDGGDTWEELDATIYPIKLNNRLTNLQMSIETGDGRPTAQANAAFEALAEELARQKTRLAMIVAGPLADFNQLLAARRLPPVTVPSAQR